MDRLRIDMDKLRKLFASELKGKIRKGKGVKLSKYQASSDTLQLPEDVE